MDDLDDILGELDGLVEQLNDASWMEEITSSRPAKTDPVFEASKEQKKQQELEALLLKKQQQQPPQPQPTPQKVPPPVSMHTKPGALNGIFFIIRFINRFFCSFVL